LSGLNKRCVVTDGDGVCPDFVSGRINGLR
jgi:hypothetical protein